MRQRLIGAAILVLTVGVATHAREQPSPLDAYTPLRLPARLPPCSVDSVLMKLARTAHVATGFEQSTECRGQFPRVDVTEAPNEQTTTTVRQVLDEIVALAPEYAWKEMDGVAVIRPRAAWADSSRALNARLASFQFADTTLSETMGAILRVPAHASHLDAEHFTVVFNGGTLAEALNALVRTRGNIGWKVALLNHGSQQPVDPAPSLQVSIRTFNAGDRAPNEGALSLGTPLPRFLSGK